MNSPKPTFWRTLSALAILLSLATYSTDALKGALKWEMNEDRAVAYMESKGIPYKVARTESRWPETKIFYVATDMTLDDLTAEFNEFVMTEYNRYKQGGKGKSKGRGSKKPKTKDDRPLMAVPEEANIDESYQLLKENGVDVEIEGRNFRFPSNEEAQRAIEVLSG